MSTSGHWYDRNGEAKHTILGKNGKIRSTTLRDARSEGWYPSVTTIMKVLASPELDKWKQQQVLLASMTLPRQAEEDDESYMSRIMQDAFKQVDDAADLGTQIHAALQSMKSSLGQRNQCRSAHTLLLLEQNVDAIFTFLQQNLDALVKRGMTKRP